MIEKIETIVSDWSGVISDDARPVYEANLRLLNDHGRRGITFEEWRRLSGATPSGFLENCGIKADPDKTYDDYKRYFSEIVASGEKPNIFPGVRETLEELKKRGKRLIVLSSHPEENLAQEMQGYGIESFFELTVGSAIDKVSGLRGICNRLLFGKRYTLYVGDTIYDVRAAKEAEVLSAAVCNGYHDRERLNAENPDFLLENFSGLLEVVN